jgi:protocatechuate 3,4-dioxygenase beta subunit
MRRRARADLYACEGCEGAREAPAAGIDWQARIAAPDEPGERLRIVGIVFQPDGRTPAPGVIVYAYHTDAAGLYSRGTPATEWSRRHGLLRGWVGTGADGRYAFDTVKPAMYPNRSDPAHVHLTILEPGRRPYWIDDIVFAGESRVDDSYRRKREDRGGSGIVSLDRQGTAWLARRDIVLEPHP